MHIISPDDANKYLGERAVVLDGVTFIFWDSDPFISVCMRSNFFCYIPAKMQCVTALLSVVGGAHAGCHARLFKTVPRPRDETPASGA